MRERQVGDVGVLVGGQGHGADRVVFAVAPHRSCRAQFHHGRGGRAVGGFDGEGQVDVLGYGKRGIQGLGSGLELG